MLTADEFLGIRKKRQSADDFLGVKPEITADEFLGIPAPEPEPEQEPRWLKWRGMPVPGPRQARYLAGKAKSLLRGVSTDVMGVTEGIGNVVDFLGATGYSEDAKTVSDYIDTFNQRHLTNPDNDILDDISAGLGSTIPFLLTGMGAMAVGRGAVKLAPRIIKTQKALKFAGKLATLLGIPAAGVTEALVEGGMSAFELRKEGAPVDVQNSAFWTTFNLNIPTNIILNRWMFPGTTKTALQVAGRGMGQEGLQETVQSVISQWAQGKEVEMGQALYEGGIGAIVGGGMAGGIRMMQGPDIAEPAPAPTVVPILPIKQDLTPEIKQKAMDMAFTDPVAAMKSVTPVAEWGNIDEFTTGITRDVEADLGIPTEGKRATIQGIINGHFARSLGLLGPQQGPQQGIEIPMPTGAVVGNDVIRAQVQVLNEVAALQKLSSQEVSSLVEPGDISKLREFVEQGLTAGQDVKQIARGYSALLDARKADLVAQVATTPQEIAETPSEAQIGPVPAQVIEPAQRWEQLIDPATADPDMAVMAMDMDQNGEAEASIIKNKAGKFFIQSAEGILSDPADRERTVFDTVEEAQRITEIAIPMPVVDPVDMTAEDFTQAVKGMAMPEGVEAPGLGESLTAQALEKEAAREAGVPVVEDIVEPAPEDFEFDMTVVPEVKIESVVGIPYEQAKSKFPRLTEEQHNRMVAEFEQRQAEFETEQAIKEEIQRRLETFGSLTPVLDLIKARGFLNAENLRRHWAGEISEDLKWYVRKDGRTTLSEIAEAAREAGIIKEYDENLVLAELDSEVRLRSRMGERGRAGVLGEAGAEYVPGRSPIAPIEAEPAREYATGELLESEDEAFPDGEPEVALKKAVDDIAKNVKPTGQWWDLRLAKVIKQIEKDFKEKGLTVYKGQKIETIQDVAELAALARHPLIEHFQVIKIKDGKFAGSLSMTSGKASGVNVEHKAIHDFTTDADEFYVSHNHPSGNPAPSKDDIDFTFSFGLQSLTLGRKFRGHIVTDHEQFSFITPAGVSFLHRFEKEKQIFRMGKKEQLSDLMTTVLEAKKTLQGKKLGIIFLDVQLHVMSFDNVEPTSDYNAYVKRNAAKYGATKVILAVGENALAKMKPVILKGNYLDLVLLEDSGVYFSAALGNVKGFKVKGDAEIVEEGVFDTAAIRETPAEYRPDDYERVARKARTGMKLTLRGRLVTASFPDGIRRGTVVKLFDINRATGEMLIEHEGKFTEALPTMFQETYVKPKGMEIIPGQPIKTTILQMTGVKPVERMIETTEMKLLNLKLSQQEKASIRAARVATRAEGARLIELFRTKKVNAEAMRKTARDYLVANIPVGERERLIRIVEQAQTVTGLAKAVVKIERANGLLYRGSLIQDIKKIAERTVESERVDANFRDAIKGILSEVELQKHRPDTILRLRAMRDHITDMEKRGIDVFLPDSILKSLGILARRPLEEISDLELDNLLSQLLILESVGRHEQITKDMAWEMRKVSLINSLVPVVKPLITTAENAGRLTRIWEWAQECYKAVTPMAVIFDQVDGGKGTYDGPHSRVLAMMNASWKAYLDMKFEYLLPVATLAEKHELNTDNFDRIGIYAAKMQKGGVERVLAGRPDLAEMSVKELKLTPQEMEVYVKMREAMEQTYPLAKRVMRELYNKDLGSVENYFTYLTDFSLMNSMQVLERLAGSKEAFSGYKKNIHKGFTISRLPGAAIPIQVNAMKVFIQHMDDVCYLISMQENIKIMGEVFNSDEYLQAAGVPTVKLLRTWIDILARKGGAEYMSKIPLLDMCRKNVSSAVMGFKLSTFLIQNTALMDASAILGGGRVTEAAIRVMTDPVARKWLKDNFSKFRDRIGDDIAFVDFAENEWLGWLQKKGYGPMKWMDCTVASTALLAGYNKKAAELGIAVDFTKPPDKQAGDYAILWMERTQTSPTFMDLGVAFNSPKYLFGNTSVNKAVLQFKSFSLNRWSFISYDIPKLPPAQMAVAYGYMGAAVAAEMGVRGASKAIVLAGLSLIGLGLTAKLQDISDDDQDWLDYFMELIDMVPFVSDIFRGIKYQSTPMPVVDMGSKVFISGGAALNAKNNYELSKNLRKSLQGFLSLAGVPGTAQAGQIFSLARNPKLLRFPFQQELAGLDDIPYDKRTRAETDRYMALVQGKSTFMVSANAYRYAIEKDDYKVARAAVDSAVAGLKRLK